MVIERFEGDIAIIEVDLGKYLKISLSDLPKNVSEGDYLMEIDGVFKVDTQKTAELREEMFKLQENLWK